MLRISLLTNFGRLRGYTDIWGYASEALIAEIIGKDKKEKNVFSNLKTIKK